MRAGVNTLQDAIETGKQICMADIYAGDLANLVNGLELVWLQVFWRDCPKNMAKAKAKGDLMYGAFSKDELNGARRGDLVKRDCGWGGDNAVVGTPECPEDADGKLNLRRDCFLMPVGKGLLIHSLDGASAVRHDLHQGLGYSFLQAKSEGHLMR